MNTALPPPLDKETLKVIHGLVRRSPLHRYVWEDRGVAPMGYLAGMATAFAVAYGRLITEDPLIAQAAKADTHDEDVDALSWYAGEFADLGMANDLAGANTLRHLYVLMIGLGMRESCGMYCEGRDVSAENVESDTAEAGLFQASWNIRSCCPDDMQTLFDQYNAALECGDFEYGYEQVFKTGVHCSDSSWSCYGSGDGLAYQELAKKMPLFACEVAAIGLRNRRQHWGPINRREVELKSDADNLLLEVQEIIDERWPEV